MEHENISKIQEHYLSEYGKRQIYLKKYFDNDKTIVPVYQRTSASPLKDATHTNLHTNFFTDIINRKVGYSGQDITYNINTELIENESLISKTSVMLKKMERATKQATMNSQSIQKAAVAGISHRLCYTEDGVFKIKNLEAEQVVYDYDNDIFSSNAAYYFYSTTDLEGDTSDYCNVYDDTNVYYYIKSKKDANGSKQIAQSAKTGGASYVPHNPDGSESNVQPHNFSQVPVIPFLNNTDWKSECEDSVDLMDVYDEIISDTAGELKAARLAYLKIWGDIYTGEDADGNPIEVPDYLREFGTLLFGKDEMGNDLGDASFLEKTIDDTAVMNMKNTLRQSIYEVSGSIDLKDLTEASSARVFTVKAALMRLENSSKTTENLVKMALYKQLELWTEVESTVSQISIDSEWFDITFRRNFIEDVEAQAETLSKLINTMSQKDAYRIAGFEDSTGLAERYQEYINDGIIIPDREEDIDEPTI